MADPRFCDVRACVFDAYGTLFDVGAAAERCRSELDGKADALSSLWREKQLQYTWLRSLMGAHADFWTVTGEALDFALEATGLRRAGLRDRLMELYRTLDCYPEVTATLGRLRAGGIRTAILSNGSPAMLASAVESAGITSFLDAVLSVEEVGVFKPDRRVYQLAVDRLGVAPDRISFQTSNGWDAAGAAHFGFRVAWCNRSGQPRERLPAGPDVEIRSLDALPGLIGLDTAGIDGGAG